jgi:hypothetical protein
VAPGNTAQGASTPGHYESGQLARPSTSATLLIERSRRRTVASVLDRLVVQGGEFAERRQDGSGWSAKIPAHRETPR